MKAFQSNARLRLYSTNDRLGLEKSLLLMLISGYLIKKQYSDLTLYTDNYTAELLQNTIYTDVKSLDTKLFSDYDYEALSKMMLFSEMTVGGVYFDYDYFLFNKKNIEEKIQKNDIVCGWIDTPTQIGISEYFNCYTKTTDKLKSILGKYKIIDRNFSLNGSVMAFNKKVAGDISIYYKNYIEDLKQNIGNIQQISKNAMSCLEQHIPIQYFLEKNYKIEGLIERDTNLIFTKSYKDEIENNWVIADLNRQPKYILENGWDKKYIPIVENYIKNNDGYHLLFGKQAFGIHEALIDIVKKLYPEVYEYYCILSEKQKLQKIKNLI